MVNKLSVLALCAATSFQGATAAIPHHRHQHPRRDVIVEAVTDVVVVTEYATVTYNPNAQQSPAPAADSPAPALADAAVPVEVPAAASPTTLATLLKPSPSPESSPQEVPAQAEKAVHSPSSSTGTKSTSSSGGKRGAAFNDGNMVKALLEQSGSAISWLYNWAPDDWDLGVNIPFYPTMWGEKMASDWPQKAKAACDKGTDVLFSFNEPDNAGQANMAPAYAATKHQEWMNPFADRARISAPSISSSQEKNQGIDWLTQFFTACAGQCKVDFCNAHWYGPGGDAGAEEFLTHLKNVRDVNGCNGKVWVTEFMPQGSTSDNEAFMRHVVSSLESPEYDFVEKYSYFMVAVGESYLMSSETQLNTLGKIYANLA